jgi:hypothetical protein
LNDGQEDDNDKEEEGYVKEDSIDFVVVTIWWLNFISNPAAGSHSFVQVEHEALEMQEKNVISYRTSHSQFL